LEPVEHERDRSLEVRHARDYYCIHDGAW
jgi:hypothetical protein